MTMSNGNPSASVNRPLIILTLAAAAVALYGYLQPDPSVAGRRFYLDNAGGAVLFTHAAHQEQDALCVTCHHELIQGQAYDCSECHDDPEYVHGAFDHEELLEIEDHSCIDCHLLQPDTAARSCRACHPLTAGETVVAGNIGDCQQCHDDPDYTPEEFAHPELLEIEEHSCDNCHQLSPVVEIYHDGCTACHRERVPERFINDQDQAICKACHLI
ncbi:MAG: cytochrome c family protein [Gemmatimonadales bacterium]|nr:cytochrome c family protein [Gemmatimonadales bacterium]